MKLDQNDYLISVPEYQPFWSMIVDFFTMNMLWGMGQIFRDSL